MRTTNTSFPDIITSHGVRWLGWILFGLLLLAPHGIARADMGPKPTMEFVFIQSFSPPLTIVEGTQLECDDAACTSPEPLADRGPQGFRCTPESCESMAYGYRQYQRLVIRFSDGKVRESNVFEHRFFDAQYQVTVRADDLLVEEDLWRSNSAFSSMFSLLLWLCVIPVLLVAAIIALVWLSKCAGQSPLVFAEGRGPHILAWIVSASMFFVGLLFSLTLPLTLLIETLLAGVYVRLRQRSMVTLVTLVALVNAITQPLLLFALSIVDTNGLPAALLYLLLLEILIWLGEALMLYLPLRKEIAFKEALGVSLLLNAASLLVGLFLRV